MAIEQINEQLDTASYEAGFIMGQTSVYIEQVLTGAKLAAQIGCSNIYLQDVLSTVKEHDCHAIAEDRGYGRVAIWIFKQPFVSTLIEQISKETTPPTASEVWSMGKLFGYNDFEIGSYLLANNLV